MMTQLKSTTLILFVSGLYACMNQQAKTASNHYVFPGTWKLFSRIDKDSNQVVVYEPTLGSDPISFLMYDSFGNISVQIMKRNRTDSVIQPQAETSNNSQAFNGYDAYFGKYEVDTQHHQIIHKIEGSMNASDVGKMLRRNFEFSGDTLRLSFSTTNRGVPVTRTVTFIRQKNSR